jgi:hypothetical protein
MMTEEENIMDGDLLTSNGGKGIQQTLREEMPTEFNNLT